MNNSKMAKINDQKKRSLSSGKLILVSVASQIEVSVLKYLRLYIIILFYFQKEKDLMESADIREEFENIKNKINNIELQLSPGV